MQKFSFEESYKFSLRSQKMPGKMHGPATRKKNRNMGLPFFCSQHLA